MRAYDLEANILHRNTSDEDASTSYHEKAIETHHSRNEIIDQDIQPLEAAPSTPPPPDGGLNAWTQVLMGHITIFNTWGYINSFGVFQTYYVTTLDHAPSDISWVGSVQIFLLFFVGTFSGRAADAGFFRHTFAAGLALQLVGVFATSWCTTYRQLFLAQGICTGLGNGLLFCPALSVLSTYFAERRALAIGIAACGTATGGMVFPAVVRQLLPAIGFGWTVRVLGFIMLGTMGFTLAFTRSRLPPRRSGPLIEWAAFTEIPYLLYAIGVTLCFWGMYFAFYYIGSYAETTLNLSTNTSITLLLILNGCGVPGRLIPNYIADRYFGPLNTMIPFAAISALLIFVWIAVVDEAGLVAFAVIYGLFSSGMLSLFPAVLSSLTEDLKKSGVRMGMVMSCLSFAVLTGPPIGGVLVERGNGRYLYAQLFAGVAVATGVGFLVAVRFVKTGPVLRVRV